jgi:hypothetical protein
VQPADRRDHGADLAGRRPQDRPRFAGRGAVAGAQRVAERTHSGMVGDCAARHRIRHRFDVARRLADQLAQQWQYGAAGKVLAQQDVVGVGCQYQLVQVEHGVMHLHQDGVAGRVAMP